MRGCVVLDFPGNTRTQRAWFRELINRTNVEHELHFVDASDALCKNQLRHRSKALPTDMPWTSDADFDAINAHFQIPLEDERFNVVRHERISESSVLGTTFRIGNSRVLLTGRDNV